MAYTPHERRLLARYFSEVERRDHADVYLVRNLPPEVAATLNGVYSRSRLSMRDNFLQRLEKGLQESGRSVEDLDLDGADATLEEVLGDRSGKFLKTYAIDHGHNSLREGSVLHLAVENVSQLVTRFLQRERRCSFEESSTRYISFSQEGHWRDPDVIAAGGEVAAAYEEILQSTFALYQQLTDRLYAFLEDRRPLAEGEKPGPYKRALRAEAFDAARYLLTPALLTKWGMVIDARTLAEMVTELLSHPLAEFRTVGQRLKEQGDTVVRTLLTHARPNPFLEAQHGSLVELAHSLVPATASAGEESGAVKLLSWDRDLDNRLLASLAYEHSSASLDELRAAAAACTPERREELFGRVLADQGSRDPLPAACEGADPFEFEVLVDFGAYRDIGRHRKGFQQQQLLTTAHGYAVPPLIDEAGAGDDYRAVLERAAELREKIAPDFPLAAGYVTPFAFLQRVRLIFDPRQVAYFVELRSGPEGHFSYRDVAIGMYERIREVSPLFASLVRAQIGKAFLGRMEAEQGADERRRRRMERAGDLERGAQ